jgi:hypothetical protein
MLDGGKVASRKELAQTLGVSQARVSQMLGLLKLTPSFIDAIVQLGDPMSERTVSERSLRRLVRMDHRQQIEWLEQFVGTGQEPSETSAQSETLH